MSSFLNNSPTQIGVLYNNCYGGFSLSERAVNMYKDRKNRTETYISNWYFSRTDPVLIDIYNEIGKDEFSNKPISNIEMKYIDIKYKNFYTIIEYDGLEEIEILYDNYKLSVIKDVSYDEYMKDEEKILKIKEILEPNFE